MIRTLPLKTLLVTSALLGGCTVIQPPPAEQILGRWQANVGGYPVTVSYDENAVTVAGAEPVSYSLIGDELQVAGGESQVRHVSFPSRDEMVQHDPLTGTETRFVRAD